MRKQWKQWETVFLGSKITADGDCSHDIKRSLILRKKVMTNLDSILKSRDITLPANVHLIKVMAFPVVMYGCESWTIKKTEYQRINAFELWCWRRLWRVPWTARRSNQSLLKEVSPDYSLEGPRLNLKLQYFDHLLWGADPLEKTLKLGKIEGGRSRGWQDEMLGWYHRFNGHESEQGLGDGEGQGSLECCSLWGRKELDTAEWLNNKLLSHFWLFAAPRTAAHLDWVAMPSSRGSSQSRNRICFSFLLHWQAGSLPLELPVKPYFHTRKRTILTNRERLLQWVDNWTVKI